MDFLFGLFGAGVPSINAAEVNEKLKGNPRPVVVDVRQPEEYRSGHIAGAKLMPLGELDKFIKNLPENREIICVCHSGSRSVPATRKLTAAGLNAINMKGGMIAWEHAKLPVKKGNAA